MLSDISSLDSDKEFEMLQKFEPIIGTFGLHDGESYSDGVAVIQCIFYAKTVVRYYLENFNDYNGKSRTVELFIKILKEIVDYNKLDNMPKMRCIDLW